MSGIELISQERERQIEVEKFDVNRDKEFYEGGQLVGVAMDYIEKLQVEAKK